MLNSVPVSALNGTVGKTAGETSFTLQLTGCAAPGTGEEEHFSALFQATNRDHRRQPDQYRQRRRHRRGPATAHGAGGTAVNLAGGAAVAAGDIVLAEGQTSTSYDYAVQYVSEAATVTPGPVLGSLTYTLRYE
ncbi:fimbrial subunit CupA1 [Pseudomonas aeruginosa]|nr:fimbrial subunit CupA1 [Pseudomonas aeruginosa]